MKHKSIFIWILALAAILLTGCNMLTIDQMYCLPKRPEGYLNLQSAVDNAMSDLEYHAPISGDNQQPVQMVDLDGDGDDECLVFAKGSGEKPLKVLIFTKQDNQYALVDKLELGGTAFEQIQYIPFADDEGYDVVIGRQLSDQVVRPVTVHSMIDGGMVQLLTTHYSRFVTTDLNADGLRELMILRPGDDPALNGIAELYSMRNGVLERSQEVSLSEPSDHIKRIMVNKLSDGPAAVYVASDVGGSAIITDVFALLDGAFTNVSLSNESGTSVQTLRNYYVYADDVDKDGILELPDLLPVDHAQDSSTDNQYVVRWYAMESNGKEVDKAYTYHSFPGGWYLELPKQIAPKMSVQQFGNSYEFSVRDKDGQLIKLMTVYSFTGQDREEHAIADNRFVLLRTDSTVYAGHLEVASAAYQMTQETLIKAFHLITQNLAGGEI